MSCLKANTIRKTHQPSSTNTFRKILYLFFCPYYRVFLRSRKTKCGNSIVKIGKKKKFRNCGNVIVENEKKKKKEVTKYVKEKKKLSCSQYFYNIFTINHT